MANEMNEIMDQHPGILFFPHSHTWKGMLTIECPWDPNQEERLKIYLKVPNYPNLKAAELLLDPKISSTNRLNGIKKLLKTSTSVSGLLSKLQNLLSSSFSFEKSLFLGSDFSAENMIEELEEVLLESKNVEILLSRYLEKIVLRTKNVSMALRKKLGTWEVMSYGLPSTLEFPMESSDTLQKIVDKFLDKVNFIDRVLEQLHEIDECCHVIDPVKPQSHHLYRRIYLDENVSIHFTADPLNASEHDVSLLGSASKTVHWNEMINNNLKNWNPDYSFYENLKLLFDIDSFPKPTKTHVKSETDDAYVTEEECSICFSMETEDEGGIRGPDKVCNNQQCGIIFHSSCLLQWLSSNPENQITFNEIQGKCPQCNENISCFLKT